MVQAEDVDNNLGRLLHEVVEWQNKVVFEAGVGTGRVTKLYIDEVAFAYGFDRSEHMLDFAQSALAKHEAKLTLAQGLAQSRTLQGQSNAAATTPASSKQLPASSSSCPLA